jgi:hypothetical protein
MDDTLPNYNDEKFAKCDWTQNYPDATEAIPTLVTGRSHTGVIIFINRAPTLWYSKRQNTVESSTFGSEFIAAKTAVDMIEGLRYKLRMLVLGITIDGPTSLFGDNQSVVVSATRASSTLKKKHNAIAYHRVRESLAAGFVRFAHEPGVTNVADILSKPVPGPRKKELSKRIMW